MRNWAPLALFIGVLLPCALLSAQQAEKLPAPTAVPRFAIVLKDRHGQVTPERTHSAHTGGGNIDIAQPRDDLVIITMTGVATAAPDPCRPASAALSFELDQCLTIVPGDPKLTKGRLTMDATVIGVLRGDKHGGSAAVGPGGAAITVGPVSVLGVVFEPHAVAGCENLAINDHKGPVRVTVQPGEYHLVQTFHLNAAHARGFCGTAATAEFAPDPALDPLWISYTDPFHGAVKKEFGFRVTLRIEPE
jgi:hypothetical protein